MELTKYEILELIRYNLRTADNHYIFNSTSSDPTFDPVDEFCKKIDRVNELVRLFRESK